MRWEKWVGGDGGKLGEDEVKGEKWGGESGGGEGGRCVFLKINQYNYGKVLHAHKYSLYKPLPADPLPSSTSTTTHPHLH